MGNENNKFGQRIREYRERLDLTLADLAVRYGLDLTTLSAIENGRVMPAMSVLTKLARALGQRLGTFTDDQYAEDPVIVRAEAVPPPEENDAGLRYKSLSLAPGKPDRHMDPFRYELQPSGGAPASVSHEGEEFIICLKGEVELVYGDKKEVLKEGDSAFYNSIVNHGIRAVNGPATVCGVVYTPS